MRLILEIFNLRWILEAAGLGPEQHYRLKASKLGRINQHRLVLAEDLVEGSNIRCQLWGRDLGLHINLLREWEQGPTSSFVMQVSPLALFSRLLQCSATEKRAQPVGSRGMHHWMAFSRNSSDQDSSSRIT